VILAIVSIPMLPIAIAFIRLSSPPPYPRSRLYFLAESSSCI